ncbi:MAG TPA: hypothetical protein VEW48_01430 [Thermoanaerobaculia bacterium]|nr:hypothetical protein [Thermoanaerobaculia bacterium]
MPTHLKNRFRIDLLGLAAAREAMVEPAREGGREFSAVDELVKDLAKVKVQQADGTFVEETGQHVEPVQLQVVCRRLWGAMPAEKRTIGADDLERFGDVTQALAAYYADSVAAASKGDPGRERVIRDWFGECLITAGGIRGQVLREANASGGLANSLIDRLRASHLVRAEQRAGATWYELAHDRLIAPVTSDNAAWRQQHLADVQRRAALWERQGRPAGLLLAGGDLAEGERWAAENGARVTDVERRFLAESRQAQKAAERERQQARRLRRRLIAATVVGVLALAACGLAAWQWQVAETQKEEAETQRQKAEGKRIEADTARTDAENQKEIAQQERDKANVQSLLADKKAKEAEAQRQRAEEQTRMSTSRQLASQALVRLDRQLDLALLLSAEATRIAPTTEARGALLNAIQHQPRLETFLHGLPGAVWSVAFSPDGKRLAAASGWINGKRGGLRLWNVATGQPLAAPLRLVGDTVSGVAFSPDGKRLATVSGDLDLGSGTDLHSSLQFWNSETFQPIGEPLEFNQIIGQMAFTPGGEHLVLVEQYERNIIWIDAKGLPAVDESFSGKGDVVAFSDDRKTLAVGHGRRITLRALKDDSPPREFAQIDEQRVLNDLAFSPDGSLLVAGIRVDPDIRPDDEGEIVVWSTHDGEPLAEFKVGQPVNRVAFSPDGEYLVDGSGNDFVLGGSLRLWDVKTIRSDRERARPLEELITPEIVTSVAFSRDSARLAIGTGNKFLHGSGTVLLWKPGQAKPLAKSLGGELGNLTGMGFGADGSRLTLVESNGTVNLWSVAEDKPVDTRRSFRGSGPGEWMGATLSPDGRLLATAENQTIIVWDLKKGAQLAGPLSGFSWVEAGTPMAFSPDGSLLASSLHNVGSLIESNLQKDGSSHDTIVIRDVHTGRLIGKPFAVGDKIVLSLAYSPDGRRLAVASGHSSPVAGLASGLGFDCTLQFWDVKTGQPLGEPFGAAKTVASLAFSRDSTLLASSSCDYPDCAIQLWDVGASQPIGEPFRSAGVGVPSLSFSPEGKLLSSSTYSVTDDSSKLPPILLWDVGLDSWKLRACRLANRNLTQAEWHQFLGRDIPYRRTCPDLPAGP